MKESRLLLLLPLFACHPAQKIYQAPAMGAETKFDEGLRPEKHPKYLWDKKMMKDLEKQGRAEGYTATRRHTAPTIPVKKKDDIPADSVAHKGDSTAMPLPDSAQHPLPDTAHPSATRQ
ncbi:hypothetical protein [Chitinophaga vietnamensis]|uniref:hypothetical protein n=1 Tax=Chitinophaga vietnamensis TaxID=2593957 RepID=UPI0011787F9C|nr:hypothetical protein [Chitinophaga vietnamensis]